jgi:hypothetical protein
MQPHYDRTTIAVLNLRKRNNFSFQKPVMINYWKYVKLQP